MIRRHKYSIAYIIVSAVLALVLFASVLFVDTYNNKHHYSKDIPYAQIYSYEGTEYKIYDISYADFVNTLTQMIEQDSLACYGFPKTHYLSRQYSNISENRYKFNQFFEGKYDQGFRRSEITFLIPYKTEDINLTGNFFHPGYDKTFGLTYIKDKIHFKVSVISSSPVTLVVGRSEDLDEQKIRDELAQYFEEHYLKHLCKYERRELLDKFFFSLKWSFFHFYYVVLVWAFLLVLIVLIEKRINKKKG